MAGKPGNGQTALITGASAGIGVDLAECFAKDGYDLIITARTESALKEVADRLSKAYGVNVATAAGDLGVTGAGKKLAADIAQRGLNVDVLVNNAGFGHLGAFAETEIEPQLGMVDLNVRALTELTHIYWKGMLAKKRGGLINVASTAAFQPGPLMTVYFASKAFVLSFTEALWEEARGTGVNVSCLCPGPTVSKFRERAGTGKSRLSQSSSVMGSAPVAREGYEGFKRNKRVVITGGSNRRLIAATRLMPKSQVLKIVRRMQSPA